MRNQTPPAARRRIAEATRNEAPRTNPTELAALKRIATQYAPVTLLVDDEGVSLKRWGKAGKFLDFPDRLERNIHVPSLARPGFREIVGPMLREVRATNKRMIQRDVKVRNEFGILATNIICEPVAEHSYLIILNDSAQLEPFSGDEIDEFNAEDGQLRFLEEELQSTRHRLRSTVEELETTNEELKSSNEEMMSMNEELQSTNEELTTVNDELKSKIDQVTVAHADLKNFFQSIELVVIVVDMELAVRSFTEAASGMFEIEKKNLGQPLAEIRSKLSDTTYLEMARHAATDGTSHE